MGQGLLLARIRYYSTYWCQDLVVARASIYCLGVHAESLRKAVSMIPALSSSQSYCLAVSIEDARPVLCVANH